MWLLHVAFQSVLPQENGRSSSEMNEHSLKETLRRLTEQNELLLDSEARLRARLATVERNHHEYVARVHEVLDLQMGTINEAARASTLERSDNSLDRPLQYIENLKDQVGQPTKTRNLALTMLAL
jgi:hypothetical protein